MNEIRIASMPQYAIAFDLETHLIQPGLVAPPIVLGSAAEPRIDGNKLGLHGSLLDKQQCRDVFRGILDDPRYVVCVANGAYDFLVEAVDFAQHGEDIMPKIFDLYDPGRTIIKGHCDGRVFEIQLSEPLHAIAQGHLGKHSRSRQPIMNKQTGRKGRYSLDTCTFEILGREDAKVNDRFRMSYAQFDNLPLAALPYEAQKYPVDDSMNTLEDALASAGWMPSAWAHEWVDDAGTQVCRNCKTVMRPEAPDDCMLYRPRRNLHDLARQAYAAWAFHIGGAWGFHIPQENVDALEKKYLDSRAADAQPFIDAGIIREDGTENQAVLKKLVAQAYGSRNECQACLKDANGRATGRIPSPKTEGKTTIKCAACDGTALELSITTPRAPADGVKKDRDTLQESGDELLIAYGEQPSKKILTTYVPMLRKGRACNICGATGVKTKYTPAHKEWCTAPNGEAGYREVPVNIRVNPLVETGRASVEDGFHGMPRKGGVRECVVARPGYVFSSEDYTAGELVTHAWSCLKLVGYSRLAEALNMGLDAHLALAGTMLGKSYEEMKALKKAGDPVASDNRQAAKGANFGFPGGMAELTFVLRKRSDPDLFTPCPNGPDEHDGVRGYKGMRPCILMDGMDMCGYVKITTYNDKLCPPVCKACVESAKRLREFWFRQWPENNPQDGYFFKIKQFIKHPGPSGTAEIVHHQSKRIRGGVEFCDGANGLFQGLLSDAAKNAFCAIQRECCDRTIRVENSEHMTSRFAGGPSPLYGSRAIMLAHDETIAEHPESVAPEAATRVSELMMEALRFMCPELSKAVKAEPTIMRRLYKGAEPVYRNPAGELCKEDTPGARLAIWEPKKKAA